MIESRQCSICLVILLSLCCLTAYAQEQQKAVVSVERQNATFQVSAVMDLPAKSCVVYGLLTDYPSLPDFIPGLIEIHAERISNSKVKVRQVGDVKILFFHIKMASLLEMEEMPNRRIIFKQTEGDLEAYSGEWNLLEIPEGIRLSYIASLSFKSFVPFFIARKVLEREMEKRFEAIYNEAVSRRNKKLLECGAGQ